MTTTGVRIEGVGYEYPTGVLALSDLDLSIPTGSSVAVVGPSGCGKSTLLQLLAGLRAPTSGHIDWPAFPPGVHPMTVVFQTDTLLPWLTAEENVGLYFKVGRAGRRVGRAAARARVDALLKMVGLQDFARAYPYQLSGGMRRRIAFLTAVAPQPAVLLLDEPFSSLDEPTRVTIHQDVLRIMSELDMTVVLVTHDLAEAITLCDDVVILTARPGRVLNRHRVPFDRTGRNAIELRHSREFLDLYALLWEELGSQIFTTSPDQQGSTSHVR
ncbi:MAG TPA: ABC transporter ATP-binding protein [Candidatus Dormibacteraeota bacterium]|nr:ABC transporter ATP-binding protein [Candidatus Dormibacteraeota bacterium]